MKTRVLKQYDSKFAAYVWWVQKWDLWDPPDLRQAYPKKYDWRFVRPYMTEVEARALAQRIAREGKDPGVHEEHFSADIVAEFDGESPEY